MFPAALSAYMYTYNIITSIVPEKYLKCQHLKENPPLGKPKGGKGISFYSACALSTASDSASERKEVPL